MSTAAPRRGRRRLGLRARITLNFALGALVLSALMATTTYLVTRSTLLRQREKSALDRAYLDARIVRDRLSTAAISTKDVLASLQAPRPLVFQTDTNSWSNLAVDFNQDDLPLALRDEVIDGIAARQRFRLNNELSLAIGVPLPGVKAVYFEVASLQELSNTLRSLLVALISAAVLTTILGAVLGSWASRRAVRPLAAAASAAEAIAGGRLDTRLEVTDDRDLGRLSTSFNDMAQRLQERIERDARFASDVSHELRSPLMTLSASVEVLQSRRDELPDRAAAALDLLVSDVQRFQGLVEDLLEISRFDAGAVQLHLEETFAGEFVKNAVPLALQNSDEVPVQISADAEEAIVMIDKRRMARVLTNLLENARKYGEGPTGVFVEKGPQGDTVCIAVEDHGPGVPEEDRRVIFERFSRGGGAGRRGMGDGVGLGLALVKEHLRVHGGSAWVEDRADGESGARFVLELPTVPG